MRAAAEQTVPLVSKTPHRVMRELYEQAIAFWRDYADATKNYAPADNYLANASTAASNALVSICAAVSSGSAASRSLLMVPTSPPVDFAPIGDPSHPKRFLENPSPACGDWLQQHLILIQSAPTGYAAIRIFLQASGQRNNRRRTPKLPFR